MRRRRDTRLVVMSSSKTQWPVTLTPCVRGSAEIAFIKTYLSMEHVAAPGEARACSCKMPSARAFSRQKPVIWWMPVDTAMSFTALDGLAMGTRCGALDPGIIPYLLRERGIDADSIEELLLYHQSGLLGVSASLATETAITACSTSFPQRNSS